MPMQEVLENLYLACLEDVNNLEILNSYHVQSILTVDSKPLMNGLSASNTAAISCEYLRLLDMESEDLLSHLDRTTQYIESCRADNKAIVVHWLVGTVIVMYVRTSLWVFLT